MKNLEDIEENQMEILRRLMEIKDLLTTPEGKLRESVTEK